jgi:hypothetical protein
MAVKRGVQIGIIAISAIVVVAMTLSTRSASEPGQYFYDLSERRLYEAPRSAFAPEAGIGGTPDDGVEAVLVCCPDCGAEQRRIAYLRTHTLELKQMRARIASAGENPPELTREYISAQTLVRRLDDETWHPTSTPEGSQIVIDWRRRCATHGQMERPVQP